MKARVSEPFLRSTKASVRGEDRDKARARVNAAGQSAGK